MVVMLTVVVCLTSEEDGGIRQSVFQTMPITECTAGWDLRARGRLVFKNSICLDRRFVAASVAAGY